MRIQFLAFTLAATAIATQAFAQPAAPAQKLSATNAEVQAMIADASKIKVEAGKHTAKTLVAVPHYNARFEYRSVFVPPAVHLDANEFFYMIDGSVDLTVGGKLVNEKKQGTSLHGTSIQGGTVIRLSKGDFYIVPANTAHSMTPVGGAASDVSLMLPVAVGAK